jgi:type IV pilus assembly protein PilE
MRCYRPPTPNSRSRRAGFTLIELMIVVAIVAILAAIALPSYQRFITESRRDTATACLLELAQFAERHHTTFMSYANLGSATHPLPALQCRNDLAAHYTFSLHGAPTVRTFALQAVALGAQAVNDATCVTLRLDQTGARTSLDSANAASVGCW